MLPENKNPEAAACHDICIDRYHKFQKGQITLSELLLEMAYCACIYGLDELRRKTPPTQPKGLSDYRNSPENIQRAMEDKGLFLRTDMRNYLESFIHVRNWNSSTLAYLQELKKIIPEEDYPTQAKLDMAINDFLDPVAETAKRVFNGRQLPEEP